MAVIAVLGLGLGYVGLPLVVEFGKLGRTLGFEVVPEKVAACRAGKDPSQRDLNIALMNELAIIFGKLGIDTAEVLEAAGTKWNFLKFQPGLVGGHCIGVDPYYLTHKAEMLRYHPQVILSGRRINDGMGKCIAEQTVKQMIAAGTSIEGARVNVLGLTFKEDCADLRNSKVVDIVRELESYGVEVFVHDPHADFEEAQREHAVHLRAWDSLPVADALVLAVAHGHYRSAGLGWAGLGWAGDINSEIAGQRLHR